MPQLLLGTLDLTRYLNVQAGEGMDPLAPAFSERVIAQSVLREGGFLSLEHEKAKAMVFPLRLNATSKAALTTLVQQVNLACQVQGQTVSWQDDGASQATVFDLIVGQFDAKFDFRKSQQGWLDGDLTLTVQPFGRLASGLRSLGLASSAGPAVTFTSSTPLAGDAPAQMVIAVGDAIDARPTYTSSIPMTMSVLPNAQWVHAIPAASTPILSADSSATASLVTASGSWGGRHIQARSAGAGAVGGVYLTMPTVALSNYPGDIRLMAICRAAGYGNVINSTPLSNLPAWNLVDLGVIRNATSIASGVNAPLSRFSLRMVGASGYTPNLSIDFAGLYVLPDAQTTLVTATAPVNASAGSVIVTADGTNNEIVARVDTLNRVTGNRRGQIPLVQPSPYSATAPLTIGVTAMNQTDLSKGVATTVSVRERTRYVFS